jgi:hypothetical protein
MKATAGLLLFGGAALLAVARPEIVTISGDLGDVSLRAWTGYALGLSMMGYGLLRSIAPTGHWQ